MTQKQPPHASNKGCASKDTRWIEDLVINCGLEKVRIRMGFILTKMVRVIESESKSKSKSKSESK